MDTKQMTDVLGQPVQVGDQVVISRTGYRELVKAEVVKLTPKGIKAKWQTGRQYHPVEETFRERSMFVKVQANG